MQAYYKAHSMSSAKLPLNVRTFISSILVPEGSEVDYEEEPAYTLE